MVITQELDPDLDPRTFRVDDFGWGGFHFELPGNQPFYNQRLDLREDYGFFVDVSATIDVQTGLATWILTTIDPATGEQPLDASIGFLPPDNGTGSGQGFASYSVRPRRTVATGDVIDAQARIIFDTEEPIDTPPIFNTIDSGAPTSGVSTLPENTGALDFLVSWSGNDDEEGSAVGNFTIYVSDNGSGFTPWLSNTSRTEATFSGQSGHSYAFYSVAQDNSGNVESAPTTPDTYTTVLGTGRIEGVNFEDLDGDSVRDEEEPSLSGWTIYLDVNNNNILDDGERSTVTGTGTDGAYSFPDLLPGTYVVAELLQAGWVLTAPAEGIYNVGITGGLNVTGLDFGNREINNAPVNTVPAPQEINEDTVLVFSSGTSNAITVKDEDAGNNSVEVALSATNGLLTLGGMAGLTFTTGDGTSDGTMRFTGTLAPINAGLEGLIFQPLTNFNGEASLELITHDLGNTGAGGPKSDTDTVPITVLPVNDAPVANNDTVATDEDSITPVNVRANDTDVDIGDTLRVSSIDTTNTIGVVTLLDGLITYNPNGQFEYLAVGETATDTFSYTATDNNGAMSTAAVNVTITGVNDAPRITSLSLDPAVINENGIVTLNGQFIDPDTPDTFTLDVAWGDQLSPNNVEQFTFGPGATAFSLAHQYPDDNPSTTPFDSYTEEEEGDVGSKTT